MTRARAKTRTQKDIVQKTEHLILKDDAADNAMIRQAADVLARGGLVAFPTETVYGLGTAANQQAVARLCQVKQRDAKKPLAYHLATAGRVKELAALSRPAAKLARLFWPGPLTLVVPGLNGEDVGLRVPAHPVARRLLAEARVFVQATSANRSGGDEPTSARQVLDAFDGAIDLILDAGALPRPAPSTVFRIEGEELSLLREGALKVTDVREAARETLLFVCRGNTCRSPMAAALAARDLGRRGRSTVKIISAGTDVWHEQPATPEAVQAMKMDARDLDISKHRSRPLTLDMIERADDIYVMERAQKRSLLEMVPSAADRVTLLDPAGRDIRDPCGGTRQEYRVCCGEIAACLQEVLGAL